MLKISNTYQLGDKIMTTFADAIANFALAAIIWETIEAIFRK